jgi:small nuclear ribonucleoprotein (snRNP)-like protein
MNKIRNIIFSGTIVSTFYLSADESNLVTEKMIDTPAMDFKWEKFSEKDQINGMANGKIIATANKLGNKYTYLLQTVLIRDKLILSVMTESKVGSFQHTVTIEKDSGYTIKSILEGTGQTMRIELEDASGDRVREIRLSSKHNLLHINW